MIHSQLGRKFILRLPRPEISPSQISAALEDGWIAAESIFEKSIPKQFNDLKSLIEIAINQTSIYNPTIRMARNAMIRIICAGKMQELDTPYRYRAACSFGTLGQRDLTLAMLGMTHSTRNALNRFFKNEEYWSRNYVGAIVVARIMQEMLIRDIPVYFPEPEIDEMFSIDLITGPWKNGKTIAIQIKTGTEARYWVMTSPPRKNDGRVFSDIWAGVNTINHRHNLRLVPVVMVAPVGSDRVTLQSLETAGMIHDLLMSSIPNPRRLNRAS